MVGTYFGKFGALKTDLQGWAWDGTAISKIVCPRDLSPNAQNAGTGPTIFVLVLRVAGICVPWDDFETTRVLGTAWNSGPAILEFFEKKT